MGRLCIAEVRVPTRLGVSRIAVQCARYAAAFVCCSSRGLWQVAVFPSECPLLDGLVHSGLLTSPCFSVHRVGSSVAAGSVCVSTVAGLCCSNLPRGVRVILSTATTTADALHCPPPPPLCPFAVLKNIALSWGVTLPVSATISVAFYLLCQPLVPPVVAATVASRLAALPMVG